MHGANIYALEGLGVFDGTECGARKFGPDEPAKRWAVAVWIVRVIDGRDPVRFCPYETVTRGHMASFLVRAFRLQGAETARFT